MVDECDHDFRQAWFYSTSDSKRFQCLECGKIINSKTFDKWYNKKLISMKRK